MDANRKKMRPNPERKELIVKALHNTYPKARIALQYSTTWELLVAVILSAQCTDVMVNKVTQKLFTTYKTFEDYLNADIKKFEQDITSTGFYHVKAKHILASAQMLKERFGGNVPDTMKELLTLPGVARKTANVILGNAFGVVSGIAVDTHVGRISQRLRLIPMKDIGGKKEVVVTIAGKKIVDYKKDADPNKIEQQLMSRLPKEEWFMFTYRIIDHGRAICKAQNPDCGHCVLSAYCPASRVS